MKYRKAAKNTYRFDRVEYRDIFTGVDVQDKFDVSWAGVVDYARRRMPLWTIINAKNLKRRVRDNWKLEYRRKSGYEWDNWSGVEA